MKDVYPLATNSKSLRLTQKPEQALWFGRSILAVLFSPDYQLAPEYLLGVLNSTYLTWVYRALTNEGGRVFAQVKLSKLKQLPIRVIRKDRGDRAIHDRIVELTRQLIELKSRLFIKTGHARTVIERQIEATDRQIDQLVYQLYDLTPEEIALVEAAR